MPKGKPNSEDDSARRNGEEKRLAKKPKGLPYGDQDNLLHELKVHQIELEMQNEELRRVQTDLEESRSQYIDLYDSAPVGYLTFDVNGVVKNINLTGAQLLGVEKSSLTDKPFATFLDSRESAELFYLHIRQALRSGRNETCELVAKRSGSAPFRGQLESIALKLEDHWLIRAVLTDITARRNAEEDLKTSYERFRVLSEATFEGVVLSEGGVVLETNDQLTQIFGYGKNEMIGMDIVSLIFPEDRIRVMENVTKSRDSVIEHRAVRKDGAVITVEAHGKPLTYMDRPIRMTAIRDITERKEAESRIEADLNVLTKIHALSGRLVESGRIEPLLQEIVDVAVSIVNAQKGTLQLMEDDLLQIVAHHGHRRPFLDFFAAAERCASMCGEATRRKERVLVSDVEMSTFFAGTPFIDVLRQARVRAVQCTPLVSRSGALLGILTTQWDVPREPDKHDLWRIDLLARQAADLIESAKASEKLRKSERRERERAEELSALFNAVPTPVVIAHSPDCLHISGNPAAENLLRIPPGAEASLEAPLELRPRNYKILKDGRVLTNGELPAQRVAKGAELKDYEFTIAFDDGTSRQVVGYGTPLKDEKGQPRGAVLVVVDITERKRAEAELTVRNAILEGINEVLNATLTSETEEEIGMACLRVSERITQSRFGFIAEIGSDGLFHDIAVDNPGWDACKSLDPDGHRRPPGNFEIHGIYGRVLFDGKVLCTNDPRHHPDSIGFPDGHPPLESFLGVPLLQEGAVVGMVAAANREGGYTKAEEEALGTLAPAIIQAILRKRAEDELKKAKKELERRVEERTAELNRSNEELLAEIEERKIFAAAMEQSVEGVVIVNNADLTVKYANPAALRLSGYTPGEAMGMDARALRSDKTEESFYEMVQNKIRKGEAWTGDYPFRQKDGTLIMAETTISPIKDGSGKVLSLVATCHDVTEKRLLEAQVRQSQKMEAIGTLAGGIAHDFNNILAGIIGFTEMAIDEIPPENRSYRHLKLVLKSGIRGRELVRQILSFSRKGEYERSPLSLSPIIKETATLLRASIPTTIAITTHLNAKTDVVTASPSEVQQIIMNLSTNAAQAMRITGGELSIMLGAIDSDLPVSSELPPGRYAEIVVKDTGTGIDEETRKRIFEPFFTTKGVSEGTGLGLSVVYGIVKDLKGDVIVESVPGIGSTFRVLLPSPVSLEASKGTRSDEAPHGQERILFIDDEDFLAELGKELLEGLGYSVTAITNPHEAVGLFMKHPSKFDLVFTDMTMPGVTGIEVAKSLLKRKPGVPIILCTGYNDDVSKEKAMALGIRGFLMKPLSRNEIATAVRRVLDAKSET